jgi:hypothetical protein
MGRCSVTDPGSVMVTYVVSCNGCIDRVLVSRRRSGNGALLSDLCCLQLLQLAGELVNEKLAAASAALTAMCISRQSY